MIKIIFSTYKIVRGGKIMIVQSLGSGDRFVDNNHQQVQVVKIISNGSDSMKVHLKYLAGASGYIGEFQKTPNGINLEGCKSFQPS